MILGRYFKTYYWYPYAHGALLTGLIIAQTTGASLMIYTHSSFYDWENFSISKFNDQAHLVLGTAIVILVVFQITGGWILYFLLGDRYRIFGKIIEAKQFHKYTGKSFFYPRNISLRDRKS